MVMGRPSDYTPAKADYICEQLAEGRSLRDICKEDKMPSTGTACRWLVEHTDFQEQYAHAREIQAELYADELVNISDEAQVESVQVSRLQIDTRKWVASKLKAKKYGDASLVKLADNEGGKLEGLDVTIIKSANTDT